MKYSQNQGRKFVREQFRICMSNEVRLFIRGCDVSKAWNSCEYLTAPLAFLGERRFTYDAADEAKTLAQKIVDETPLNRKVDGWFFFQKYSTTALHTTDWYTRLCRGGKLPNDFSSEKIFALPEEDLIYLFFAKYYFSGRMFVEDVKVGFNTDDIFYWHSHPNNFIEFGRSEGFVLPDETAVISMSEGLVERAKEIENERYVNRKKVYTSQELAQYSQKRLEVEREITNELIKMKMLAKLK